jgi:hypothetical protein
VRVVVEAELELGLQHARSLGLRGSHGRLAEELWFDRGGGLVAGERLKADVVTYLTEVTHQDRGHEAMKSIPLLRDSLL